MYQKVPLIPHNGSFFLDPHDTLDPELFDGEHMRPSVRQELLSTILSFMNSRYLGSNLWLRVWLAGSGASYRWYGEPDNQDLDILLGIDPIPFRRANPDLSALGDREIADRMNDQLREQLWPATNTWRGHYEVTWYVNQKSKDIRSIHPYAAYDLVEDTWSVPPSRGAPSLDPSHVSKAMGVTEAAKNLVANYNNAVEEYADATTPDRRVNAGAAIRNHAGHAARFFDLVHDQRRLAFSPTGGGHDDFNNFLWQHGKKEGWVQALRQIKKTHQEEIPTLPDYAAHLTSRAVR